MNHTLRVFSPAAVPPWQREIRDMLGSLDDLLRSVGLDPRDAPCGMIRNSCFPVRIPRALACRIRPADWQDPILMQVLPRAQEEQHCPAFTDDPVGDIRSVKAAGLLHKYTSRALLIASRSCPVHCRFCFRRSFNYARAGVCLPGTGAWGYLALHGEIDEIILSGGEPLMLDNAALGRLLACIERLDNVTTVRIHTRMPVAVPSRIDDGLVERLWKLGRDRACVVVVHANCAQEFDAHVATALGMLKSSGAQLLGQTVLLKGVNDSTAALADLMRTMVRHGILPYYLHQLDRVCGAWHFEVPEQRGKELVTSLREILPGYAVPRYVREERGKSSKTPLGA